MSNNKRPHSSPSQETIDAMIQQGFDPRMLEHQAQLAARNTIANTMHTHQMHPMMNYVVPPGPPVVSHRTSALLSHMPPPPQHFMLHNWHPSNPPNSTNFAGSNNNIINRLNKNNTNNTTQSKSTADNYSAAQAPQIDPEFYDKLVKMLGKEGADEIVKESLNETFMEAGKRTSIQKGGDSKSSTSEKGKSSISSKEENDVVLVDDDNSSSGDAKNSGEQRPTTTQIKDPKKAYDVQLKEFAMQFSPLKTTTGSASSGHGSGGDSKKRKLSAAELLAASAPKHQYQQRTPFSMNHTVYPMGYAAQGQSLSIPAVNNNTFAFNPSLPPPTVKISDRDDPPGLDQFRADPDFCSLILDAAEEYQNVNSAAKKHMKSVGGLFVHGLLNINDEMLNIPLRDDANGSVKAYVKNVICPYFNVPSNLPERAGKWEAYVHISSDNINEFARNVVYQRRKAMKSAVELAYYEVMNNDERRGSLHPHAGSGNNEQSGEMQDDHPSKTDSKEKKKKLAVDLERLEKTLIETIAKHSKEISALKEQHLKDTDECEANYTEFVTKLIAKHRKEKEEMQQVHTTFVESYVESSLDALRDLNDKSPK